MLFPIVIHKDPKSDYGVTVPDLPGCFSAGATVDEAMAMAREAIELHLEQMVQDGEAIPSPKSVEHHRKNRDFAGAIFALVTVDPANLRVKVKRINITLPERILDRVDRVARERGETRSGLLAAAASEYVAKHVA